MYKGAEVSDEHNRMDSSAIHTDETLTGVWMSMCWNHR